MLCCVIVSFLLTLHLLLFCHISFILCSVCTVTCIVVHDCLSHNPSSSSAMVHKLFFCSECLIHTTHCIHWCLCFMSKSSISPFKLTMLWCCCDELISSHFSKSLFVTCTCIVLSFDIGLQFLLCDIVVPPACVLVDFQVGTTPDPLLSCGSSSNSHILSFCHILCFL